MALIPFNRRKKHDVTVKDDFFNMVDDFFTDNFLSRGNFANDTFKLDVEEKEKEYIVCAEFPGAKKEEIYLDFSDGRLLIGIEKNEEIEEKDKNYVHKERRHSSMSRSVYLADGLSDGIKAKLDDGLLKVTVPKQKQKPKDTKKIEIE